MMTYNWNLEYVGCRGIHMQVHRGFIMICKGYVHHANLAPLSMGQMVPFGVIKHSN